jgi:beta-alanine--pyruvate transaminase
MMPDGIDHVILHQFRLGVVDTALKIASPITARWGDGSRTRLIGRERGYHGVGFGGISVGGIVGNRKHFGTLLTGVDHIRHTHDPPATPSPAASRRRRGDGRRPERIVKLHDAVDRRRGDRRAGGRLHRRADPAEGLSAAVARDLRPHGILLIFDEVITGFGRRRALRRRSVSASRPT